MSFIYTHNTSPRRFKKVIKNKSYYEAVDKQNKLINFISHRDLISSVRDSTKLNIILITFICMIIPIVFLVKSFGWI